jgi:hypothetical protein
MLGRFLTYFSLCFIPLGHFSAQAQEIDFGSYSSTYSVSLSELIPSTDLEFPTLIQNEGLVSLTISDAKVLSIEGIKYLDVIVDVTADEYLLLNGNLSCETDPSCRIPFTLQAAYANRGLNDIGDAINMTTIGTTASAQFAVKYRGNAPPGPPPTPVYKGYNPALFNETAYLYIYGSVNVGNIDAGNYTANINITVNYD